VTGPPRYVLASATDATEVLRRLARAGWHTREGFVVLEQTWDLTPARLVLVDRVADADAVRLAVLAAARGAGVVAVTDPAGESGRALLADLGRLGLVRTDTGTDDGDVLTAQQRALLSRLAQGQSIATAAQEEFLSLRTANRRIAEARAALGVRTTREAVLAHLRRQPPP
jgi:DNA-binding NarL/FixJ family response regulator